MKIRTPITRKINIREFPDSALPPIDVLPFAPTATPDFPAITGFPCTVAVRTVPQRPIAFNALDNPDAPPQPLPQQTDWQTSGFAFTVLIESALPPQVQKPQHVVIR
jgi:hypothetical protein